VKLIMTLTQLSVPLGFNNTTLDSTLDLDSTLVLDSILDLDSILIYTLVSDIHIHGPVSRIYP
jgi:hypothetical protein